MCEPTLILAASTAVAAGGQAYSGMAARGQAKYEAQVARNNAAVAMGQAADARDRGAREQMRQGRQVAAQRSAQIAAAAANGMDTGFGSPLDVVKDTDYLGALDAETIRENAEREAQGYLVSAQNYEAEARAQRARASNIVGSTVIDMGSTILSGATQISGMKANAKAGG